MLCIEHSLLGLTTPFPKHRGKEIKRQKKKKGKILKKKLRVRVKNKEKWEENKQGSKGGKRIPHKLSVHQH